jgi:hypothetical protein
MKQIQIPNTYEEKFTECKSFYQCAEFDPLLMGGRQSIFKAFLGLSKNGNKLVQVSYDKLASKGGFRSRKTAISHVNTLIDLGYIIKKYTGGKHRHDCNTYEVRIPRFYYDWIVPSKKVSKFTPEQQIAMAKNTLIKLGVVGEYEINHAIVQTKLKPVYEEYKNSKGVKKLAAMANINNTLKKFNEKNNVESPTVI